MDTPSGANVLMVCSSGGHLAQLLALKPWFERHNVSWVTFATPDTLSQLDRASVVNAYHPTTRSVKNLLRNGWLALKVVGQKHPDVIVTSGAGLAFPFFVLAWWLGIPTIYIEVIDRIDRAPLTTRLCRPFARRILVQWEEQLALYPEAVVVGRLA